MILWGKWDELTNDASQRTAPEVFGRVGLDLPKWELSFLLCSHSIRIQINHFSSIDYWVWYMKESGKMQAEASRFNREYYVCRQQAVWQLHRRQRQPTDQPNSIQTEPFIKHTSRLSTAQILRPGPLPSADGLFFFKPLLCASGQACSLSLCRLFPAVWPRCSLTSPVRLPRNSEKGNFKTIEIRANYDCRIAALSTG